MSVNLRKIGDSGLEIHIRDRVDKGDHRKFQPKAEEQLHGEDGLDLLFRVSGFRGWSARSLWDALHLDDVRTGKVRRLAMVGNEAAAKWLATLAPSFPHSETRFFAVDDIDEARHWIRSGETD